MIGIDIAHKSFGPDEILRDIRFSIDPRESVALLGPSGIGKTTLLRIVAGLDDDFQGRIERPDRLAMVFQEPTLLNWRTVRQNLTLVTGIGDDTAEEALGEVGLSGKGDLYPEQLSLGQRRRLSLARAFAVRPELLIMDEPFASLDPERMRAMIALTKALIEAHEVPTLFVTHSEEEASLLADRVLRLDGRPATLGEKVCS